MYTQIFKAAGWILFVFSSRFCIFCNGNTTTWHQQSNLYVPVITEGNDQYVFIQKIGEGYQAEVQLLQHVDSGEYRVRKIDPVAKKLGTRNLPVYKGLLTTVEDEIDILHSLQGNSSAGSMSHVVTFLNSSYIPAPTFALPASSQNEMALVAPNGTGQDYFTAYYMPFYNGGSLERFGSERLGMFNKWATDAPTSVVLRYVAHIAHALNGLYERGVGHNDLKDGNVLMHYTNTSTAPDFYLGDFGMAEPLRPGKNGTKLFKKMPSGNELFYLMVKLSDLQHRENIGDTATVLLYELARVLAREPLANGLLDSSFRQFLNVDGNLTAQTNLTSATKDIQIKPEDDERVKFDLVAAGSALYDIYHTPNLTLDGTPDLRRFLTLADRAAAENPITPEDLARIPNRMQPRPVYYNNINNLLDDTRDFIRTSFQVGKAKRDATGAFKGLKSLDETVYYSDWRGHLTGTRWEPKELTQKYLAGLKPAVFRDVARAFGLEDALNKMLHDYFDGPRYRGILSAPEAIRALYEHIDLRASMIQYAHMLEHAIWTVEDPEDPNFTLEVRQIEQGGTWQFEPRGLREIREIEKD